MPVRWGVVLLGALAGIGGMAVPVGVLLVLGVADTDTPGGLMVLVTLGFAAQFLAGHVAARLASSGRLLSGGLSALALYAVVGAISIAAGDDPGPATLAFGAAVALILGTSAGVLAESRHQPVSTDSPGDQDRLDEAGS